jgi:hypothetical protein
MINIKSLKINTATIIKQLSGLNVIWSNQNANTPAGDFILLKISSFRIIGSTDYESNPILADQLLNKYKITTAGDREFVLSLQCISENSFEILLDLINELRLNKNLEILSEKKLVFVGQEGSVADITTMINGAFENRASVDLIFRISKNYSSEDSYEVEIINKIDINAEITGNSSETPIEFDISVEQNN